jgi:four helix bundle protein
MLTSFKYLKVWQKAHQIVMSIYKESASFPQEEKFGLQSQIRRAAVSIPANIAEGFHKRSIKEKLRFYNIAQTSLDEVRYYVLLANDLTYWDAESLKFDERLDEIGRMLNGLMLGLSNSDSLKPKT